MKHTIDLRAAFLPLVDHHKSEIARLEQLMTEAKSDITRNYIEGKRDYALHSLVMLEVYLDSAERRQSMGIFAHPLLSMPEDFSNGQPHLPTVKEGDL